MGSTLFFHTSSEISNEWFIQWYMWWYHRQIIDNYSTFFFSFLVRLCRTFLSFYFIFWSWQRRVREVKFSLFFFIFFFLFFFYIIFLFLQRANSFISLLKIALKSRVEEIIFLRLDINHHSLTLLSYKTC